MVMAQVIEFYIPARFKPRVKWVPAEQRGRIIAFPHRLEKVGLKELKPTPGRFLFERALLSAIAFAHCDDYVDCKSFILNLLAHPSRG